MTSRYKDAAHMILKNIILKFIKMCVQIPEKQDLFDLFSLEYRDTSLITSSLIVLKIIMLK